MSKSTSGDKSNKNSQASTQARNEVQADHGPSAWAQIALRWITGAGEGEQTTESGSRKNDREYEFPLISRKSLKNGRKFEGEKKALQLNQRLYTDQQKVFDLEPEMTQQAKVLTDKELRKVLLYCAAHKHAARNRCLVMFTHLCGARAGETASLRLHHVLRADGTLNDEVRLTPDMTKGKKGRTLWISEKLQDELRRYLQARFMISDPAVIAKTDLTHALFPTQKCPERGFTASTLAQFFHYLYRKSGIVGASSHSGRRFFATKLSEQSVGIKTLQQLMGHAQVQTTLRYVDTNPQHMKAAVALL